MSSYSQRIFKKYDLKFGKNLAKFSRNVPCSAFRSAERGTERNDFFKIDRNAERNGTKNQNDAESEILKRSALTYD